MVMYSVDDSRNALYIEQRDIYIYIYAYILI